VAIVDWDVHHGNGTEAMFSTEPGVLYLSVHQSPLYPNTGAVTTVGQGEGVGTTINIPVPAGTAGDAYREASARIIEPVLTQFQPDWLLVSAGYDAHADDPLAELRLVAPDFGWLATRLRLVAPATPIMLFLEGGYHLPALVTSVAATLRGMAGMLPDLASPFVSPPEAFTAVAEAVGVAGRHWSL
jgi:acetoin utilization deacetylase AcuC-like enzyme